jgi:hypothetical protein
MVEIKNADDMLQIFNETIDLLKSNAIDVGEMKLIKNV